jgi:hypothetical protein
MEDSHFWGANIREVSQDMRFLWNFKFLLHVQKSPFLALILGPIALHDAECLTMDTATDITGIAQKHTPWR